MFYGPSSRVIRTALIAAAASAALSGRKSVPKEKPMTQYVILPSIVTEEMAKAWSNAWGLSKSPNPQADLDAFISAAPDSGLVVCDRTTLQEAADLVQFRINMHFGDNRKGVRTEVKRLESLRNRLSAALEGE